MLASLRSFCQKLPKLAEIWRSSDKKRFAQFFDVCVCVWCVCQSVKVFSVCASVSVWRRLICVSVRVWRCLICVSVSVWRHLICVHLSACEGVWYVCVCQRVKAFDMCAFVRVWRCLMMKRMQTSSCGQATALDGHVHRLNVWLSPSVPRLHGIARSLTMLLLLMASCASDMHNIATALSCWVDLMWVCVTQWCTGHCSTRLTMIVVK